MIKDSWIENLPAFVPASYLWRVRMLHIAILQLDPAYKILRIARAPYGGIYFRYALTDASLQDRVAKLIREVNAELFIADTQTEEVNRAKEFRALRSKVRHAAKKYEEELALQD